MARPHLRPTWTRRLPLRWPKRGNCNQVSSASCTRTPDCWHRSLRGGPFPVVLLEHGSSVVPAIYTVLAEGLASSGFIVIATNHPPDSLISVFPDGHERPTGPLKPIDEPKAWPLVSSRTKFWWQMCDSSSTSSRK